MIENLAVALSQQEEAKVPPEYVLFQFCREFHKLPHEVKEMSPAQYELWTEFMRVEGKAAKIKNEREKQRKLMSSITQQ